MAEDNVLPVLDIFAKLCTRENINRVYVIDGKVIIDDTTYFIDEKSEEIDSSLMFKTNMHNMLFKDEKNGLRHVVSSYTFEETKYIDEVLYQVVDEEGVVDVNKTRNGFYLDVSKAPDNQEEYLSILKIMFYPDDYIYSTMSNFGCGNYHRYAHVLHHM